VSDETLPEGVEEVTITFGDEPGQYSLNMRCRDERSPDLEEWFRRVYGVGPS